MSISALQIMKAAVDAAAAHLETHGMRDELQNMEKLFVRAVQEHTGGVPLTITTPDGNMGDEALKLAKAIEEKTGRRVDLRQRADPSIKGGAVIQYGDELIDASVDGALKHAAHSFKNKS